MPYLPKLKAVLYDLNTIPDDKVPNDPEVPELKLVLVAMKTVFRKDVSTKIKTILEDLKPIPDDPLLRRFIRIVWLYLVGSAKHMDRDYMVLYDPIKNIIKEDGTMPTMLEDGKPKGKQREKSKGRPKRL